MALQLLAAGDESGIQGDADYCVISGYIASAKEWLLFEPQWEATLRAANVPGFHAKEFFGRDDQGKRLGPYADWSHQDARVFLERLTGIIHERRLTPIGCGIDVSAFNERTEGERRWLTGGLWAAKPEGMERGRWTHNTGAPTKPYYLAFQFFLVQAAQRAKNDAQINFLFDRQNVLQAQAIRMFQQTVERGLVVIEGFQKQLRWIAFGNSPEEPSLQAADLHTHCWYATLTKGDALDPERAYAMDLLTKKRSVMGVCNREYLEGLIGRLPPEVQARLKDLV